MNEECMGIAGGFRVEEGVVLSEVHFWEERTLDSSDPTTDGF